MDNRNLFCLLALFCCLLITIQPIKCLTDEENARNIQESLEDPYLDEAFKEHLRRVDRLRQDVNRERDVLKGVRANLDDFQKELDAARERTNKL